MNFRFNSAADTTVVPDPLNGSSTRSPEFELALMMRFNTPIGIWHPCQPSRSLNVPHTRLSFQVSNPGSKYPCGAASCGRKNHVSSGSFPFGFARMSAYVVCRALFTRTASGLNVKPSLLLVKYRMWVWLLAN